MHLNEYQELAARTLGRDRTHEQQLANAALGLSGEAGETADIIKKHLFHDRILDIDLLMKEVGDVLWYMARLVDTATDGVFDLDDVMVMTINKLAERHPNGWQPHYASDRTDEAPPHGIPVPEGAR